MTNPNMKMKEKQPLKLISARDPRVLSAIGPFDDDMLALEGYKDREELSRDMFEFMISNGGIGLTANQVGLPYNMFIAGGHPKIEKGLRITAFNPQIISINVDLPIPIAPEIAIKSFFFILSERLLIMYPEFVYE